MKRILSITVLFFIIPVFAIGAEPGCGDGDYLDETYPEINQPGQSDVPIIGLPCGESKPPYQQYKVRYFRDTNIFVRASANIYYPCNTGGYAATSTWSYGAVTTSKQGNMNNNFAVNRLFVRMFNNLFDLSDSCNNCYFVYVKRDISASSSNRRLRLNSIHRATRNGVTLSLTNSLPAQ